MVAIILVSVSFIFAPLIRFRDSIGNLTTLFFHSEHPDDSSDDKLYFYLYFSKLLNGNTNDTRCADAIYGFGNDDVS